MGLPQLEVLFLTAHLPYPPASGGRRREFELISRLGNYFRIHLCSLTFEPEIDNLNSRYLEPYCASINLFRVSNSTQLYGHTREHPSLMNKYYSEEGVYRISQLLRDRRIEIVHLEGYYVMQLLPMDLALPVVLVEHNIEYSLDLQRMLLSRSTEEFLSSWREYYLTFLWERTFWKRATKVVTLTAEDTTMIRRVEPRVDVQMIPNGVDHEPNIFRLHSTGRGDTSVDSKYLNMRNGKCPSVLFVCNFAYEPNVDAAIYFSNCIFPLILSKVPNTILFLVGNSPPPQVLALMNYNNDISSHIKVIGYVDSLNPFYAAAEVVVCPLRIGGGIKVKILEALKAGKAIVSTSIGAQGLDLNSRALCICDKVSDFANNVIRLLLDSHERYLQEQEALLFGRTLPTWNQIADEYMYSYKKIVPTIQYQKT